MFLREINAVRKELIARLLHFVFSQMCTFIKANFYVTEKHDGHNQLFYYSKSVWYLIA